MTIRRNRRRPDASSKPPRQQIRRRQLFFENLEERRVMAAGPQLIGIQPNVGDLLVENQPNVRFDSPHEMILHFDATANLNPATLSGIRLTRAGQDDLFDVATGVSDFNTRGLAVVRFSAVNSGPAGVGIRLNFSNSDLGIGGAPTIAGAGPTFNVVLNSNPTTPTTAAGLVAALNANVVANVFVTATVTQGDPTAIVAVPGASSSVVLAIDDVVISTASGYKAIDASQHNVIMRFADRLPDDKYRVEIFGVDYPLLGINALRDSGNNPFQPQVVGADRESVDFEVRLGSQITSIVPQPLTRNLQRVSVNAGVVGDTFTFTFMGQTTAPIAFNDTAANVQTALEALPILNPGDVRVTDTTPPTPSVWNIAFHGRFNDTAVPMLAAAGIFSGGGTVTVGTIDGLSQALDQIVVFFDEDFDPAVVQNPAFYRVIDTTDPAHPISIPASVNVDFLARRAVLKFAADLPVAIYHVQIGRAEGVDESEAGAVNVGTVFSSQDFQKTMFIGDDPILVANDVDLYQFSLTAPGTATITVLPDAALDVELRIFDSFGELVPTTYGPGGVGVGEALTYDVTSLTGGTFYLGVSSGGNTLYDPVSGVGPGGGSTTGSYSVRINTNVVTPTADDDNSSFVTAGIASNLGTLGIGGQALAADISKQVVLLPRFPGSNDEPGHRDIPDDVDPHTGGPGITASLPGSIPVTEYNFALPYGVDRNGNLLSNGITPNQKQRAREIFELYGSLLGVQFVETQSAGLQIITGDLFVFDPTMTSGPGGVLGLGGGSGALMDAGENWGLSEFGGFWMGVAFHEIGHALGLEHSYDLSAALGQGIAADNLLAPHQDIVHGLRLFPTHGTDIDLYQFQLAEAGYFTAETFAERAAPYSFLNTVISLYDSNNKLIARNDDYFGQDSFVGLKLAAGTYSVGVTSTGNTDFDPSVSDSGFGGRTDGNYELKLNFTPSPNLATSLVDRTGEYFDGNQDNAQGGTFDFWFRANDPSNTIYVDKHNDSGPGVQGDGSLADPYDNIETALADADTSAKKIVRIVGNGGLDGQVATIGDNRPYLVGFDSFSNPLSDGSEFLVPQDVTVMIDAGALLKLQKANIDIGTSSPVVTRTGGALQVLGTPTNSAYFRSFLDDSVGGDSDGPSAVGARGGDWGGLVFRNDSDLESIDIYLNYVNHADLKHGGGRVSVNSVQSVYSPIHLVQARPTISYNTISFSSDAAVSADPNSFQETEELVGLETVPARVGPEISNNSISNNTFNALFVRIATNLGAPLDQLSVSARFDDTDIVHVITETLEIVGYAGGPYGLSQFAITDIRAAGRLAIDPGTVVKLVSRIELLRGTSQLIAEGTKENPIIFTSTLDDRYGAGGTFDTSNNGSAVGPAAADWAGLMFNHASLGSIDNAVIAYGGGDSSIEGGSANFNVVEIHQAKVRLTNSTVENNAAGLAGSIRNGREDNVAATIFVRAALPVIANNIIQNNAAPAISINASALEATQQTDWGRGTGRYEAFAQFNDNHGPLVRLNRMAGNTINGLEVRGQELTTETVWDDADVVHVLQSEITMLYNHHTYSGLRLQSSESQSLVVKLLGATAGFTADGLALEIDDRIGGTIQMIGTPGHNVVLTSLRDCTVGAGFTPQGLPQTNTQTCAVAAAPGNWRSILLQSLSNDRNVAVLNEQENARTAGGDSNGTPAKAQNLGVLAKDQKSGDENSRLGFEVHGTISIEDPTDVDVYSFSATTGTQVWLDIDRTSSSLDTTVELLDDLGNVLAYSNDSLFDDQSGSVGPASLQEDPFLGEDYYSLNPRDAGMRLTLPGLPVGVSGTYFVRVSSNGGHTRGEYQLQVRMQQRDEKPGSTIRYSDISYATTGIEVQGLPAHSPLLAESLEVTTIANDTPATAQNLGNLLATDRNTLSVGGQISALTDADFYRFGVDYLAPYIQDLGAASGPKSWATVFDLDYADGLTRPDTSLGVFTSAGQLVLIGRESNVADDQPADVSQGTDADDLLRGSASVNDPFIGPVIMPEGNGFNYRVSVYTNAQLPSVLDQTYNPVPTSQFTRLEPVNSLTRIAEDHIGFSGYDSNGPNAKMPAPNPILPTTPSLFDINDPLLLSTQVVPLTLTDVQLYVSQVGGISTVNPLVGGAANVVTISNTPFPTNPNPPLQDIVMRSDGHLMGYRSADNSPATNSVVDVAGRLVELDAGNGAITPINDDGIRGPNTWNTPSPYGLDVTYTDEVNALTYNRVGTANYDLYYSVRDPFAVNAAFPARRYSKLFVDNAGPDPDGIVPTNGFLGYIGGATKALSNTVNLNGADFRFFPNQVGPLAAPITVNLINNPAAGGPVGVAVAGLTINVNIFNNAGAQMVTAQTVVDAINSTAAVRALGYVGVTNGGAGQDVASQPLRIMTTAGGFDPGAVDGVTTGLAYNSFGILTGVSDQGEFYWINDAAGGNAATFLNVDVPGAPRFQGLALGPQNVEGGAYANMLFAIDDTGGLYAFDNFGNLQPVFDTDGDGLGDATSIASGISAFTGAITGLAFSPLDFNLWHPTTRRGSTAGADLGHGINDAYDNTRDPGATLHSDSDPTALYAGIGPATDRRDQFEDQGGASFYFGFEQFQANITPTSSAYFQYGPNAQYGILSQQFHEDLSTNPAIRNTYNLAGGAKGTLQSNTFDLSAYTAQDHPVLYFNYYLQTQDASGTINGVNSMRDSARVFVSPDGGTSWEMLATNNTTKDLEKPTFQSHIPQAKLTDARQQVQELFDTINWRQARIDLSNYAGNTTPLQLRFDFSTAGTMNQGLPGDDNGLVNRGQAQNNQFEGFYVDDLVVGFAERGEMVTSAASDSTFFTVPPDPDIAAKKIGGPIPSGEYQIELRRGTEYGEILDKTKKFNGLFPTQFDTNDQLIKPGFGALGDANLDRQQGLLALESNIISNSKTYGISVDAAARDAGTNMAHPGSPINFNTLNASRLAPGIVISNNVIHDNGTAGILFSGDPIIVGVPLAAVPFGKIINNTIVGGSTGVQTGIGVQVTDNASPTLINNIVAFTTTGISVDGTSGSKAAEPTVVDTSLFRGNGTNVAGVTATNSLPVAGVPILFVNAAAGNYYLQSGSPAIDSSLNSLPDRFGFLTVKTPLGIPNSDVVAPNLDILGLLRVDDLNQNPPSGLGSNIYKDRGAIERADFVGPFAEIIDPADNDALGVDIDTTKTVVWLTSGVLSHFDILLADGNGLNQPYEGTGVDPATVNIGTVTIIENGVLLVSGIDFQLGFDASSSLLRITPISGVWRPASAYEILLNNTIIADYAGNKLRANQTNGTTKFTVLTPGVELDYGDAPGPTLPTTFLQNGARHVIYQNASTIYLGNFVDTETVTAGQPTAQADGDDVNATLVPSILAIVDVTGSGANLTLAGNVITVTDAGGGVAATTDGQSFFITRGAVTKTIEFDSDGVETAGRTIAPFTAGATTNSVADAIVDAIRRSGLSVSATNIGGGQVQIGNDDDEDGVTFGGPFRIPFNPRITSGTPVDVTASGPGFLDAWIDWDNNGDWTGPFDHVFTTTAVVAGINNLSVVTPASLNVAVPTTVNARFRLSLTGNLSPNGIAVGGEVEDYQITIYPGQPPVVVDETYTFEEDKVLTANDAQNAVTAANFNDNGVLANDTDADGDTLQAFLITGPQHAQSFVLNPDGTFVYTPLKDYNGTDSFTYRARDNSAGALVSPRTATVTINVKPVNDAPFAYDDGTPTAEFILFAEPTVLTLPPSFTFASAGLVVNDKSPNGTPPDPSYSVQPGTLDNEFAQLAGLKVSFVGTNLAAVIPALPISYPVTVPTAQGGTVTLSALGGTLTYTPAVDFNDYFNVLDSFTYFVQDDGVNFVVAADGTFPAPSPNTQLNSLLPATTYIRVKPRNDAPINSFNGQDFQLQVPPVLPVNEDTRLFFRAANNNALTVNDVDVARNELGTAIVQVTLTAANGTVSLNPAFAGLTFAVGGGDGTDDVTMTFTGTIANINAALEGSSFLSTPNYNTATGAVDGRGAATVTITVNDLGNYSETYPNPMLTDTDVVTINVSADNDPPVNNTFPMSVQTVAEDTSLLFSSATSNQIFVSDVDYAEPTSTNLIEVTLTAVNGTITLANITQVVVTAGANGTNTVRFQGTLNNVNNAMNGMFYLNTLDYNSPANPLPVPPASLTITSNDLGNVGAGGAKSDTDPVAINVTPVNDAPINRFNGAGFLVGGAIQTIAEDIPLVFNAANLNRISIFDVDALEPATTGLMQVKLDAVNGTVTLSTIAGLTLMAGANGSNTVTVQGAPAALNTALDGMFFRGSLNYNLPGPGSILGPASLTITTNDLGNVGAGGPITDTDVVAITVTPVDDAPTNIFPATLPQQVLEDNPLVFSLGNGNQVRITDLDFNEPGSTRIMQVTLTAANGTITLFTTNNISIIAGANGSNTVTFQGSLAGFGSLANVINAMNGMTFLNTLDYNTPAGLTDARGPASLTITSDDLGNVGSTSAAVGGRQAQTDVIPITVNPVNDAPVNRFNGLTFPVGGTAQTVNEDTPLYFNDLRTNRITVTDVDVNDPTPLTATSNQLQVKLDAVNGTVTVVPTVGVTIIANGSQSVTLQGSRDNLNSAMDNMFFQGNLHFNTATSTTGPATLTITTNDLGNVGVVGPLTDVDVVTITVGEVNDDPINRFNGSDTFPVPAFTTAEDTTLVFNAANNRLVSVFDQDSASGLIQVTLTATNGTLTLSSSAGLIFNPGSDGDSDPIMTFRGSQTLINQRLAGMQFKPLPNYFGPAGFTITTNDLGLTGLVAGVQLIDTDSVSITVTPVNDAPANVIPVPQSVREDATLTLSTLNGNQVAITDDAGPNLVEVTLQATNGLISLASATPAGLTFSVNNATSQSLMTFTGTVANIRAALENLQFVPPLNYNGPASIQITTNDFGFISPVGPSTPLIVTDTLAITVAAVNDPPVNTVPGAQTTGDSIPLVLSTGNSNAISIADLDAGNGIVQIQVTATNGTLTLATVSGLGFAIGDGTADPTMRITGTINNINAGLNGLIYTPDAGYIGPATITILTNDLGLTGLGGQMTDSDTVAINVVAVNHAPVNSVPGTQSTAEDTALVFAVANGNSISVSDDASAVQPIRVTLNAVNGVLTLPSSAGLTFATGDGLADASMTVQGTLIAINAALNGLSFQPTLNFNGAATVQIVTDDLGNGGAVTGGPSLFDADVVTINVTAVNDLSTNTVPGSQVATEGIPLVFTGPNSIAVNDVDGGPIQITLVATNGLISLSGVAGLIFTQGDGSGDPTMTFTGTQAAVNAALNGLAFTALDNGTTNAQLAVTSGDPGVTGAGTVTTVIPITIALVNNAPVNTLPSTATVAEGGSLIFSTTNGNAISVADDANLSPVQVSLTVTNGTVQLSGIVGLTMNTGDANPAANLVFTGTLAAINGALNGLTFRPAADFAGTAVLTVLTSDLGNTGSGGTLTDSDTFNITVTPINDAPVNTVPGRETIPEDTTLIFDTLSTFVISVADVDAATSPLELTLTTTVGTLSLAAVTGLTFTIGDGTTDGTMTFQGTLTNLNAALNGLVFTPPTDFNGAATLTLTTNDLGNTGVGGTLSDTDSVAITVTSVNDGPVANGDAQFTAEDAPLSIPFATLLTNDTRGAANESGETLTLFSVSPNSTQGGTVTILAGSVIYTPRADFFGTDTFTYNMRDNGTSNGVADPKTATGTVTVTISSVNDAPRGVDDIYFTRRNTTLIVPTGAGVLLNDSDVDGDPMRAVSPAGINNGTLLLNQDGSFSFQPTPGFFGQASFTYRAADAFLNSSVVTVVINVDSPPTAVNDLVQAVQNTAITFSVLGNDSDPDGQLANSSLAIVSGSGPSVGSLVKNNDNTFTYTPGGSVGSDSFRYTVSDTTGNVSNEATVSITIGLAPATWQNPDNHLDVNRDGFVSPLDALIVINDLNFRGARPLFPPQQPLPDPDAASYFLDVNGDRSVAPIDALLVINYLNALTGNAEGESRRSAAVAEIVTTVPAASNSADLNGLAATSSAIVTPRNELNLSAGVSPTSASPTASPALKLIPTVIDRRATVVESDSFEDLLHTIATDVDDQLEWETPADRALRALLGE